MKTLYVLASLSKCYPYKDQLLILNELELTLFYQDKADEITQGKIILKPLGKIIVCEL